VNPFEGALVRLAPVRREDIPLYTRWFQDYEVGRLLIPDVYMPLTVENEEDWYSRVSTATDSYTLGIRTIDEDRLLGNASLFSISQKNRAATFGIVIGEKDFWGRGYGLEATRLMVRFGFDELNLNRIQLDVYDYNPRAIRAYEKAGFCKEGVRRQAVFREGAYHDVHLMAILREEWLADH
jgi:RimJ/RimL family protein N-acetyltransferase